MHNLRGLVNANGRREPEPIKFDGVGYQNLSG